MAKSIKILWASKAMKVLDSRDRYTRSAILEDFTSAPHRDVIPSNEMFGDWIKTPVSNSRFSVYWQLQDGDAIVRSVVPGTGTATESEPEAAADRDKVLWESDAIKLLDARDRFTRSSILEDFTNAPESDAVRFDHAGEGYLTPVSNRRYSVVWHRKNDGNRIVRAVVPMINAASDNETELKARVERAIERESRGVAY